MELEPLIPHIVTGVIAGAVAWGGVRVEMRWLREMIDNLRFTVHSPKNPNNLLSTVQAHGFKIASLEEKAKHGR